MRLVDLHTHTTASDGTLTPEELVRAAAEAGIGTLSITDHDRIFDHPAASALASESGIELICGVELSCRHAGRTVHLLGYFFDSVERQGFGAWLNELLESRRDRNRRLARRLQELGLDVSVEEADRHGHGLTARPHFARVLIEKGYVATIREAFDRYLGESAPAYVERESPDVGEALERMRAADAVSSLAHPVRTCGGDAARQERLLGQFAAAGLHAIEAFHPDHSEMDTQRFLSVADKYGMAVSGGSDFHGANKPGIQLGTGIGDNLRVPDWVVPALRECAG